ncbi:MAG: cytochrome c [Candidatus Tectomicrobia bacterium]|nr:cytochrome c [Candidatus Tectomicrobia bacterium]
MRVRAAVLAVPAFCAFTLLPAWAGQPIRPLKEQVASGKMLFDLRGCSTCHAVMGKGGRVGPSLDRVTVWASPLLGASIMWNHVPLMEKAMREQGLAWPQFRQNELHDLFTYLHSLNPRGGSAYPFRGEARLGAILFAATCQKCHGAVFEGGFLGPDLGTKAAAMVDEEEFASGMLRHAPIMVATAREVDLVWPQLSGSEMANILAYVRSLKPGGN